MSTASNLLSLEPLKHHLVSQFARPRGLLGSMAGRIMSKRGSNVDRNLWLVQLLSLEASHRVLEIGPGPGVALAASAAAAAEVVGVDHSTTMLAQARRRNRRAVAEGRVSLVEGAAEKPPPDLGQFDRIYCMNVWQFWSDQEAVLRGLVGHLGPGGVLAVGFQPRHQGATSADTDAASRRLEDQLTAAGLGEVTAHRLDLRPIPVAAVLGRLVG